MSFCINCLNAGTHGAINEDTRPEDTVPGIPHLRFCVCAKGRRKKRDAALRARRAAIRA